MTDRNTPSPDDRELIARAAKRIHEAMVWAALQHGEPKAWVNGNSYAEDEARVAARAVVESLLADRAKLLEALRRISNYRSEAEDLTPEETIWRTIDEMQEIALTVLVNIGGDDQ